MSGRDGVVRRIALGSGRCVMLYDWSQRAEPRYRNLVCVDGAGQVVWRAELPPSPDPDCFTRVDKDHDTIVAHTDRGVQLRLSPGTGRPLRG